MKKILVLIASSAEWYEFTVYSFCAVYIGNAFFPQLGSPFANFLAAFGAFAAGFLARPLGGLIFGYIGDKKSRSGALAWAAFFMGVPTVGIAILPTYSSIGIIAPILLVIFRILQGIAIGGQYSGSVVILVEAENTISAKAKAGASVITSAFGGMLLAILSFQIIKSFIPDDIMIAGGWRILFAIAIILVILAYFIKHSDHENKQSSNQNIKFAKLIIENYKSILFMFLLCFPGAVVAYFQITILPNIITQILKHKDVDIIILTAISIVVFILSCNLAASLIKYFNLKKIIATGLILIIILPLPMYALYKANSELLIVFFIAMGIIFGIFYGNIMVLFTECFPKSIRYTSFALAYNMGFGAFGGLLPFICFYLANEVSDFMAVSVISISAITGLLALKYLDPTPKTLSQNLIPINKQ